MHASPHTHLFLNVEGVVYRRGSANAVFEAADSEALQSVWCWAKPLDDIAEAMDLRLTSGSPGLCKFPSSG